MDDPGGTAREGGGTGDVPTAALHGLRSSDPHGELVDRTGLSESDLGQIDELMAALVRLRAAEQRLAEASMRYMELNETDMRALHFLIVCEGGGTVATAGAIGAHLEISSASTTKLLDRLERAGHVRRGSHPSDRRALAIQVEPATRAAAMRTVGAQQARRVSAARRLDPAERDVVIAFLDDMTAELSLDDAEWARPTAPEPPV